MALYETARVLASFATATGVAIAAWQIWRNAEQTKTAFEDSLNKEYRELMRPIPLKALVGEDLSSIEAASAKEAIYNYLDFCNQQIFLRKQNRIRKSTWLEWQQGMKINLGLPLFSEVAAMVLTNLPGIFGELRKVRDSNFNTDPKEWP